MILAAGRGERLRPLTDTTPKALVAVAGKPLIDHQLERLAAAGVTHVVVNLDWLGEHIVAHVGDGRRYGVDVVYSPETGNVLETAGGIVRALPLLGDAPFWVVNADVFATAALPDLQLAAEDLGHLLLVPRPAFRPVGDFAIDGGRLTVAAAPPHTFSGMALYRPELFADLAPGRAPLAPLLRSAAQNGRLGASLLAGAWEDVGTAERLAGVRQRFGD